MISRHVYQPNKGGQTYVPLEERGRTIGKATPRLAKMLSWKYAQLQGSRVEEDLAQNHGLKVSKKLIQSVNERVGKILIDKEKKWKYENPCSDREIKTIGISRDGTTIPIKGERYKETMAGTISLYDDQGQRKHTIYIGCSPEEGKETFSGVLSQEIERIKVSFPLAKYVGIADGEKGNWTFLNAYTTVQIIDFYHATSYLGEYAKVAYENQKEREEWLAESCSKLKNKEKGASELLTEMEAYAQAHLIEQKDHPVRRAVTYFTNHRHKMNYDKYQQQHLPIGSGVVEAACKTLVKQRFSKSGCRWTRPTVDYILLARGLILTKGRWKQFWNKIDRYGF